ncbi:MAG: hypothetical protein B7Y80_17460 [Hyphomicrobium sp. 32-62-53]|nr:MAG: hypothetical protein B7Z29_17345 [Hyphomicrobium sp. 12-62-95]OYX97941.1 MAG: hypothetical protein B7Y80_17460 [Hyphomicrobium sp. 32-62-53]
MLMRLDGWFKSIRASVETPSHGAGFNPLPISALAHGSESRPHSPGTTVPFEHDLSSLVAKARLSWLGFDTTKTARLSATEEPVDEFAREPELIPSDSRFGSQWHNLNTGQSGGTRGVDINITPVWDFYSGEGVKFGVYDDGIDNDHVDLSSNYDGSLHVYVGSTFDDPTVYNTGDAHGTSVAGLIAARLGGGEVVGGSFNGSITGVDIFGPGGNSYLFGAMNEQDRFDVTNHSWGWVGAFADNKLSSSWTAFFSGLQDAAANGRGGLGTIQMVAAGNDRGSSDNSNTSNFTSSRFVNAIAAIANDGQISSYSNPGASLLVSSPSNGGTLGITTTDYSGSVGYSSTDYTTSFGGTSAATPIASGVVGLMLDANPLLGYRDVMEILAISASQIGTPAGAGAAATLRPWQFNGATNWNNGGMHFSHDYGFGLIDAFAAVKLAQSWNLQQTFSNELTVSASNSNAGAVPDNNATGLTRAITLPSSASPITIETIEVQINWSTPHAWAGDLVIELISPSGTTSYLLDRTGGSADLGNWTFMTRAHLGEQASGTWTVRVTDRASGDTGTISSITLRAFGSNDLADTYYYTDEFGALAQTASRQVLSDTDGGIDTLSFAALSSGARIDLNAGQSSSIAGRSFVIAAGTVIENVIGTWSADTLVGNDAANRIMGNQGDDTIDGRGGDDHIYGGAGSDSIDGGSGTDWVYFDTTWNAISWDVSDLTVTFSFSDSIQASDTVTNVEYFVDGMGVQMTWFDLTGSNPAIPPAAPVIVSFSDNSGSASDSITNDTTPTLAINTDAGVETVEIFRDGQSVGFATGGGGSFSFTSVELASGNYAFTAKASRGGLQSASSAALAITIDAAAAQLQSFSPADDATAVNPAANIVLTFDEAVVAGSGSIQILRSTDGSLWRSIDVRSPEVAISGTQVVINPAIDLPASTSVYVVIDAGAFVDVAGNAFAGINDASRYNFTTAGGNVISGDNNANTLTGTAQNDVMYGYGGNDSISGNGGDDIIDGGAGNDTLNGGTHGPAGDTASYATATAAVTVTLATTASQNTVGAGSDRLSNFENLTGSAFNDRLTGSTGNNIIEGGLGNDLITGGRGVDALIGGDGSDTFDFNAINETGNSASTRDLIMDFEQGQDRIDLSTIDASSALSGNNTFIFRGAATSFGTARDGEIRYVQENGLTVIYGDTDGDTAPEFQIALTGQYSLTAGDFIL